MPHNARLQINKKWVTPLRRDTNSPLLGSRPNAGKVRTARRESRTLPMPPNYTLSPAVCQELRRKAGPAQPLAGTPYGKSRAATPPGTGRPRPRPRLSDRDVRCPGLRSRAPTPAVPGRPALPCIDASSPRPPAQREPQAYGQAIQRKRHEAPPPYVPQQDLDGGQAAQGAGGYAYPYVGIQETVAPSAVLP